MKKAIVISSLILAAFLLIDLWLAPTGHGGPEMVAQLEQDLRRQGFKVTLADFDLSSTGAPAARAEIISAARAPGGGIYESSFPLLQQLTSSNAAIVVWRQPTTPTHRHASTGTNVDITWEALEPRLDPDPRSVDDACQAILSGPFKFDLHLTNAGLPSVTKNLYDLDNLIVFRCLLALHQGKVPQVWTNLLGATRIATAWDTEPVPASQSQRCTFTAIACQLTWQALQTNCWTDAQLAQLQHEWAALNLFTNLVTTTERECADFLESRCLTASDANVNWGDDLEDLAHHPSEIVPFCQAYFEFSHYRRTGVYVDETNLLALYTTRELQIQHALVRSNWLQMRSLPGISNCLEFIPAYDHPLDPPATIHSMNEAYQRHGFGLFGETAEAETQRRMVITALGLQRYRLQFNRYPDALADVPTSLFAVPPIDFMNGQPLHYQLMPDGRYLLYSVGLNGLDNHGAICEFGAHTVRYFVSYDRDFDLVWPLPSSDADVADLRQKEMEQFEARLPAGMFRHDRQPRSASTP